MQLRANEGEQVGRVGLVEHGEVGVEAEEPSVAAQDAVADRMERAAPDPSRDVVPGVRLRTPK